MSAVLYTEIKAVDALRRYLCRNESQWGETICNLGYQENSRSTHLIADHSMQVRSGQTRDLSCALQSNI